MLMRRNLRHDEAHAGEDDAGHECREAWIIFSILAIIKNNNTNIFTPSKRQWRHMLKKAFIVMAYLFRASRACLMIFRLFVCYRRRWLLSEAPHDEAIWWWRYLSCICQWWCDDYLVSRINSDDFDGIISMADASGGSALPLMSWRDETASSNSK